MKQLHLLLVLVLVGCSTSSPHLKSLNSYQLCAALSESETVRNTSVPNQYKFRDKQIKEELIHRNIDPLGLECGAVGAQYQHNKMIMQIERSRESR